MSNRAGEPEADALRRLLERQLSKGPAPRRALVVDGPGRAGIAAALEAIGVEEVVSSELPAEPEDGIGEAFDLVHCGGDALRRTPSPVNMLTQLWKLAAPDAVLLLESEVLDQPGGSRYARFLPSSETTGAGGAWVPSRLVLRWMVEASGFDVERWLGGDTVDDGAAAARASLRARRAARAPEILSQ